MAGRWKSLDMLVLNAATLGSLTPVSMLDAKEYAQVLTLNVGAQASLLQAFDPLLKGSDRARVIGITSSLGTSPRPFWGAYASSKAAFEVLVNCYGLESANISTIRTAIVDPGATATKMRAKAFPGEDPARLKQPDAVGEAVAKLLVDDFETGFRMRVQA